MSLLERTVFKSGDEPIELKRLIEQMKWVAQDMENPVVKISEIQSGYEWVSAIIVYGDGDKNGST